MQTPLSQQNAILRRIGVYEKTLTDLPYTLKGFMGLLENANLPSTSIRQYQTQFNKIAGCLAYSNVWSIDETKAKPFSAYMTGTSMLFFNHLAGFKAYINEFMIAAKQSDSTIKAFLDAWIILGDYYRLFPAAPGGSFPKTEVRMLFDIYDNKVQEKAIKQEALLPTQDEIYDKIIFKYLKGSQERAMLVMYTYVALRDDLWDAVLIKRGAVSPKEGNYFLFQSEEMIFFFNRSSKTFGTYYEPVEILLPVRVCIELTAYFEAINFGRYPFGRSLGKRKTGNSQRIIKLMAQMGVYLLLQNENGSIETRGFGIDAFRRLNRTAAEKDGVEKLAQVTGELGHTVATGLKYRGKFVNYDKQIDLVTQDAQAEVVGSSSSKNNDAHEP